MKLFSSFSHPVGPRPWTRDWIVMQWDTLILWKKLTAITTLIVLTASIIPVRAYFENKARYVELATRLSEKGIVDTSYTGTRMNEYVPQEETVRIAINLGGGLDFDCQGSRFLSTDTTNVFDCGYQDFAQKK
jgi:hypothetical protein